MNLAWAEREKRYPKCQNSFQNRKDFVSVSAYTVPGSGSRYQG